MIIAIDPATGKWQKITDDGFNVRVSTDGKTLAFGRFEDGIWNCDTGGSNNPGKISDKSGPVWSPDGKHLVATKAKLLKEDSDKPRTAPWRMDADGRNEPTSIAPGSGRLAQPSEVRCKSSVSFWTWAFASVKWTMRSCLQCSRGARRSS